MIKLDFELVDRLRELGFDVGDYDQIVGMLVELNQKLAENQGEIMNLKRGSKNYDIEMTRLAGITQALQLQIAKGQQDLVDSFASLCELVMEDKRILAKIQANVTKLDETAVKKLFEVEKTIRERFIKSEEYKQTADILNRAAAAIDQRLTLPPLLMPWKVVSPGQVSQMTHDFISRFADQVSTIGGAGEDQALEWFSVKKF